MPKKNPKAPRRQTDAPRTRAERAAGKTHPGAGTMYDWGTKKLTGVGIAVIIAIAAGTGVFFWGALTGWKFAAQLITPPPTQPTQPQGFSLSVWDGVTFDKLNNGDFSYILYGTNDLNSWTAFEEIENGDSLDSISNGDLVDYSFYVVSYEGIVEIDDPKITDETLDQPYYLRWDQLFKDSPNNLYAYATPSASGITALNSETFTPISLPLAARTNITIIVASNSTQPNAAWVSGWNFQDEGLTSPNIIIEFDYNVAMSDFSISGMSKDRFNNTALRFTFDTINASPQMFAGSWGSVSGHNILEINMFFGEDLLSSVV